MFCRHNYEIIKEYTTESKMEQAARIGLTKFTSYSDWLDKQHIVYLKCSKCNKIRKDITFI